ncbi:hypothetical protein DFH94DRAFT_805753 [Russula ochroleuca]|uniref:Uncharacterized protein n=1 Tax=Russula ochroleuca TaxID=152965 RepID=A0A9P5K0P8_9AGAM|nr:hypothetical protein DFH94DRAFT_805753 [Russula ochroleuca]
MAECITRPSNAAAHPGMVDRNPTCCSKEEARAKKEAIAMAKAQAAMGKKAKIEKLATIEKAEKQKAKDMDCEADDPVGPLSQARARMSRKRPVEVDETPTKRMRCVVSGAPTVEHNKVLVEAKLATLLNESGESGSKYEGEQESEGETNTDCELEIDEPDMSIKKGGKKQKKGLLARDQSPAPAPAGVQEASPESESDTTLSTCLIYGSTIGNGPSRAATTEPDDATPAYRYGGFVSENSGSGQKTRKASETLKYKSITKIQELHAPPMPLCTANSNKSKKKILYDDLPAHTKDRFKKKVILLSLETTGALKPWFIPKDNVIIDIWNLVFGAEHCIEDRDIHCKCFLVVKTLIKRAISTWLHKFAETAVKALAAEFAQQGLDTQAGRSSFVIFLLGNIEDLLDKKRPFLWESVYNNPSARQEGIFQGRLVGQTFLEHLQIINNIDPNERVQEPPVSVLILAVQAVHRALLYSIMGAFQLPSDKRSAEFSKTNWGDYSLVTPCGERVFKRATVFLKAIKNLKKEQWTDIFKVAMSFQVTNKHPNKLAKEDEEELSETDSDEYDNLVDPRYNEKPVELDRIALAQ